MASIAESVGASLSSSDPISARMELLTGTSPSGMTRHLAKHVCRDLTDKKGFDVKMAE